jgi:hypothetical protein
LGLKRLNDVQIPGRNLDLAFFIADLRLEVFTIRYGFIPFKDHAATEPVVIIGGFDMHAR